MFASYKEAAILAYANENVTAGRWTMENAPALSKVSFETLLPQGLATPNNYIYEIQNETMEKTVGTLWFAVFGNDGLKSVFICDIEIKPDFRRQGHAKAAFRQIEEIAHGLGLPRIGLHVFSHNLAAQALYHSLGYGVTGVNVVKTLSENGV
jgi:ribosomal protein S18 acetylase RimI-like enzyme